MERDNKIALDIITDILGILNKQIVDIDKRVEKLEECHNDYEYTTIKIPINASNLDVLRKVFGCKIIFTDDNDYGITCLDLDEETTFHTKWLKHKFFIGNEISEDEIRKHFGVFRKEG